MQKSVKSRLQDDHDLQLRSGPHDPRHDCPAIRGASGVARHRPLEIVRRTILVNSITTARSRIRSQLRIMRLICLRHLTALGLLALGAASASHAQAPNSTLADLPITEVPAATGHTLAIFWSGDGGWAALVSSVSKELAANGVAVVGVNARAWMERQARTPDDVARDTERLLRAYLAQWSKTRILLLGYSRGAGFVPFIVNRLPADLRARVDLVGMLGAEHEASFEFHLLDLVRSTKRSTDIALLPEVQRTVGTKYFCLYGTSESDTICPQLDSTRVRIVARDGDHHFDRNYPAIAQDILRAIPVR